MTPNFCPVLTKLGVSRQMFLRVNNIKFHGNPSSSKRPVTCGQTKKQQDKKRNSRRDGNVEANRRLSWLCEKDYKEWSFPITETYIYTWARHKGSWEEWRYNGIFKLGTKCVVCYLTTMSVDEIILRRRCESMSTEHLWNNTDREARSAWKKTCSTGIFYTKNVTRNSLGVNSDLRDEKPEINHLVVDGFQWLFQAGSSKFT
jgi:hypothetical protein